MIGCDVRANTLTSTTFRARAARDKSAAHCGSADRASRHRLPGGSTASSRAESRRRECRTRVPVRWQPRFDRTASPLPRRADASKISNVLAGTELERCLSMATYKCKPGAAVARAEHFGRLDFMDGSSKQRSSSKRRISESAAERVAGLLDEVRSDLDRCLSRSRHVSGEEDRATDAVGAGLTPRTSSRSATVPLRGRGS
jgi:hypothetical protein